ncbi:MAG TPA: hypothetical protein VIG80_05940 [Bacillaceae bacterium]
MKMNLSILILLSCLLLASGCSSNANKAQTGKAENSKTTNIQQEALEKLSEDHQLKVERATPVQLMNLYFEGINEELPLLTVSTLHPELLQSYTSPDEAAEIFKGYKVKRPDIKEDEEKNKSIDQSKEYYLIVDFEVTDIEENSQWAAGPGRHTRFVTFVKMDKNRWSIKELATSP